MMKLVMLRTNLGARIDGVKDEVSSSKDYLSARIGGVLTEIGKVNARVDDIYKVLVELPKQE